MHFAISPVLHTSPKSFAILGYKYVLTDTMPPIIAITPAVPIDVATDAIGAIREPTNPPAESKAEVIAAHPPGARVPPASAAAVAPAIILLRC